MSLAIFIWSCCKVIESPHSCTMNTQPSQLRLLIPLTHLMGQPFLIMSCHSNDQKDKLEICSNVCLLFSNKFLSFSLYPLFLQRIWISICLIGVVQKFYLFLLPCLFVLEIHLQGILGIMATLDLLAPTSNSQGNHLKIYKRYAFQTSIHTPKFFKKCYRLRYFKRS